MFVAQQAIKCILGDHHCTRWHSQSSAGADSQKDGILAAGILHQLEQFVKHNAKSGGSNPVTHA